MDNPLANATAFAAIFGLCAALAGFAIMLIMPDRRGYALAARLVVAGGLALGYELVAASVT
jgi:hypothetical protein